MVEGQLYLEGHRRALDWVRPYADLIYWSKANGLGISWVWYTEAGPNNRDRNCKCGMNIGCYMSHKTPRKCRSSEEMGINFWGFMHLHFLPEKLSGQPKKAKQETGSRSLLTILNVLISSFICWASRGVSRLQVAISPRLSYSPLGQVSWNWIRGLKTMFFVCGVIGVLLDSDTRTFPDRK